MKSLPEILRDAMLLLDERRASAVDDDHVVIARGQQLQSFDGQALRLLSSEAFQIRLRHDTRDDPSQSQYRCEARTWLGAQWSSWSEQCGWLGGAGFDIRDVLATDWRIVA